MLLTHISVSAMDNNCYLLCADGQGLLIDAADDAKQILQLASDNGVKITKVLTTHQHHDHVRALQEILTATGATHYASALDAPGLPAPVDITLTDGDVIEFGGDDLRVIILRGHTPGGACLVATIDGVPNIFIGDSLFPGGLGKTASEELFTQLFADTTSKVFDVFPDETVIWPGHGKPTTLGDERPHLDEWWDRKW
ncbi:Zn-dependent hydrolase, glyoxylase [Corynebacterium mustelae]|uniref:Zn-dependent hydrolase, glyoxylase n=1 Tax=Corynebacterium mustelae TaxID=571915 RepID=A0A0G3GXD0_9CORY|nr:MBL fold metallo-hydrolase [Corynebacterium mustelae]AKK05831.1 Zn-dependent hydrolase, glyoxylase [Corynebacterium mustelae]